MPITINTKTISATLDLTDKTSQSDLVQFMRELNSAVVNHNLKFK